MSINYPYKLNSKLSLKTNKQTNSIKNSNQPENLQSLHAHSSVLLVCLASNVEVILSYKQVLFPFFWVRSYISNGSPSS